MALPAERRIGKRPERMQRVAHHVEVQVPVPVAIEKHGLCGKPDQVEAICCGTFFEPGNALPVAALVDEELIMSRERRVAAHVRYIDIEQSVAVDVDEHNSGRPELRLRSEGAIRNILESEIPLVDVQPVLTLVRREVEVRQTVAVEISGRNTATVVVVEVIEDVQRRCGLQLVDEADPRCLRIQQLEALLSSGAAGQKHQAERREELVHGEGRKRVEAQHAAPLLTLLYFSIP